ILLKNLAGARNNLGPTVNEGLGGWVAPHFLPTIGSQSRINLNADCIAFDPLFKIDPGHHMDQSDQKTYGRYVVAHEFGHQFDIAKNRTGIKNYAYNFNATTSLYDNPNVYTSLSHYGKKSPMEAYAETFAEWHLSRGKTTNPAAIAYARHEK